MHETQKGKNPALPRKISITKTFLLIYGGLLVLIFALPFVVPAKTSFEGRTAREFTVAAMVNGPPVEVRAISLQRLRERQAELDVVTFLLPQPSTVINAGDTHRADVIEDHGTWQLVGFYYSNTRTSTSIYRAYADRIEPLSYRITSSVGQMMGAMFALVPALVASLVLVPLVNWIRRRRAARLLNE